MRRRLLQPKSGGGKREKAKNTQIKKPREIENQQDAFSYAWKQHLQSQRVKDPKKAISVQNKAAVIARQARAETAKLGDENIFTVPHFESIEEIHKRVAIQITDKDNQVFGNMSDHESDEGAGTAAGGAQPPFSTFTCHSPTTHL